MKSALNYLLLYLNEKTGIILSQHQLKELTPELESLVNLNGLTNQNVSQFFDNHPKYMQDIIEKIVVNETYFFRNSEHFSVLETMVFPILIDRIKFNGNQSLRILSVGCSTGQEAYSILMNYYSINSGKNLPEIHIDGIDLSKRAILQAMIGEYSGTEIRGLSENLKSIYFTQEKGKLKVKPILSRNVSFIHGNILNFQLLDQSYDLIFARNMLIYFDDVRREMVKQKLFKTLRNGGYLFLGESEVGWELGDLMQAMKFNQSIIYRKR